MEIYLDVASQSDIEYALDCLLECRRENAEEFGFNYPYFSPGGAYGKQWWQLDSSLALCGYKWFEREFAETSIKNFCESQRSDGRICLYGEDILPEKVANGDMPMQREDVSSLPKLFDVAYHIVNASQDLRLLENTYSMMKKYVDWWFNRRMDKDTGLITAVFEETFIPYLGVSGEYAPVDTNTEVYVGCHYTQLLAERLEKENEAEIMRNRKDALKKSINKYLWDEEAGVYFPYDIKNRERIPRLTATTFCPLRLCIADSRKRKLLIEKLTDDRYFDWDSIPLTSAAKTDRCFTVTTGEYKGNASWSGSVWTLINEMVIRGLVDSGENELAAELAIKTIKAFNGNLSEFINPFDGSGHGVQRYAWSASQYLELIIEVLFGMSFDAEKSELTICPKLTPELKKQRIYIVGAEIADKCYADVEIDCGKISCKVSDENVRVTFG